MYKRPKHSMTGEETSVKSQCPLLYKVCYGRLQRFEFSVENEMFERTLYQPGNNVSNIAFDH